MRVFLDTNVLASAAATRGLCADVLREVLARHELVVSKQVLEELGRVLGSKFGVSRELIEDFIELVQTDTVLAVPGAAPKVELRDKDDLAVLAAAIAGGADVFVTGDKELQVLGRVAGLKVLSPRRFWEELKGGRQPRSGRGRHD